MVLGRPDLSTLETEFERGDRFYEPQYADSDVDIRFRESEGQQEHALFQEAVRKQAVAFYDSFL